MNKKILAFLVFVGCTGNVMTPEPPVVHHTPSDNVIEGMVGNDGGLLNRHIGVVPRPRSIDYYNIREVYEGLQKEYPASFCTTRFAKGPEDKIDCLRFFVQVGDTVVQTDSTGYFRVENVTSPVRVSVTEDSLPKFHKDENSRSNCAWRYNPSQFPWKQRDDSGIYCWPTSLLKYTFEPVMVVPGDSVTVSDSPTKLIFVSAVGGSVGQEVEFYLGNEKVYSSTLDWNNEVTLWWGDQSIQGVWPTSLYGHSETVYSVYVMDKGVRRYFNARFRRGQNEHVVLNAPSSEREVSEWDYCNDISDPTC
jgi:hypothetical protein